jgi:predicted ATP-grasp superfamily ATP-dependent carboligase
MPETSGQSLPHLRWTRNADVSGPVLLVAFGGWNDAGDSATTAIDFMAEQWNATSFADIDPEVFYDFTITRPEVRVDLDGVRRIDWPSNEFRSAHVTASAVDVILLSGIEPQLKWRTFCEHVIGVALATEARMVVTLGALLAEVPHSRPVSVFGATYDDASSDELDLLPSRYEGPTGITGVLHNACREVGIRSAALWAAVPTYVPSAPSPKAALALVDRTARLLDVAIDTTELKFATDAYEHQVSQLVAEDDETTEYVAHLERRFDEEPDTFSDGESLVDEVERFLRDQD